MQTKKQIIDSSVMTFTGHNVYQTLLRCHFSSKNTTNSRYIYVNFINKNNIYRSKINFMINIKDWIF